MARTKTTETLVAEICLYGTSRTGAGWLARTADGRMFGTGEPCADRSFTEAVWQAQGAIEAAGVTRGAVRIFEPNGERMATAQLGTVVPTFGNLAWQAAPVYAVEAAGL